MTINNLKSLAGQDTAIIATIKLDACRHTTAQSVIDGRVTLTSALSAGYTGSVAITGGNAESFIIADPFLLIDDEIIEIDVISNTELTIISRGKFGTTDTSHDAGVADIKHSGEVDGSCYGFAQTCSSGDSYQADLYKDFVFPSAQLDWSKIYFNGFSSWSHTPAKVDPGQTIGSRAKVSLTLLDHVEGDTYVPYADRRTSDGTLWKKIFERHPNIEGRPLIIETGFDPLNYNPDNFIRREYVIDSINESNGSLRISALDPLILADDKVSKAPIASQGVLADAIDLTSTEITYTSAPEFDYSASGTVYVRIDSEVIECTVLSDFVLTIVTRGVGGTENKQHAINSTVQKVLFYDNVNVVEIIVDLIENYTPIKSTFLDDYTEVIAATSTITLTAYISKSTSVKTLINELIKNGDLVVYYDEENQKIKIKLVGDATQTPIFLNEEDHIERGSIKFTRLPKEQYTRYSTAWAPNDITKTTDEENFSIVFQAINLTNELPKFQGETNEKDIFFNRWLTTSNEDVVVGTSIAQRVLDRAQELPYDLSLNLDIESVFDTQGSVLENGSIATIASSKRVNKDGSAQSKNYQVLSMKDLGNMKYTVDFRLYQDPLIGVNVDFTIDENKENYILSDEFAPTAGHYIVLINTGVTIGSTSTSLFAFTTGVQASGVSFEFIIRGSILSKGGRGGDGGDLFMPRKEDVPGVFTKTGSTGFDGGNVFEATVPCTINVGSGAIWAGGGGASGEKSIGENDVNPVYSKAGNGGPGGQGYTNSGLSNGGTVEYDGSGIVDTGIDGTNGNLGSNGILGNNYGGKFGESGKANDGILGGLTGFAIVSNGNNVTITNGDNPINIKGRRS